MKKIALAAMILGMAGVLGACSMDGDGAAKTTGGTTVAQGTSQEEKVRKRRPEKGKSRQIHLVQESQLQVLCSRKISFLS